MVTADGEHWFPPNASPDLRLRINPTAALPRWFLLLCKLLADIARINPFTHAVETIRFAFAGQINRESLIVSASVLVLFVTLAIIGYSPARGTLSGKAGSPA